MKELRIQKTGIFPEEIHGLLRTLYRMGFFSHSLLAGSWIFPLYEAVFNIRYALKTFDIDFAIDLVSLRSAKPANLEKLFKDLGYVRVIDYTSGLRKYSREGFEIEFLVQRKGDREPEHVPISRLNVTATPLPFLDILFESPLLLNLGDLKIKVPCPEALFIHKLIVAQRRRNSLKEENDLSQCRASIPVLETEKLQQVIRSMKLGPKTKKAILISCEMIHFPPQKLGFR
jgi:hypothetical protein